jgi:hypothetical protein
MSIVSIHGPTMLGRVGVGSGFANAAALKADGTVGDGAYTGNTGDYTITDDGDRLFWDGSAWQQKT